jgi:hypothetical protein
MFQFGVVIAPPSVLVALSGGHEKTITSWSEAVARSSSISHGASAPILRVLKVKSIIEQTRASTSLLGI